MNVMQCKNAILFFCCASLVLSGCAGRAANPVMTNQPGDQSRSCFSLASEMNEIEGEINKRLPKESRTGQNVALGRGSRASFSLFHCSL